MRLDDGVTIAIPNWNHELLLCRAVRSALAAISACHARGWDGEVMVVDDASRDGSPTLLRQLEALHHREGLKVLGFTENGGLSAARNQALMHARYRYIVFLDADNEIVPENLPTFIDCLTETGAAATYGTLLLRTLIGRVAFNVVSNESIQDRLFEGNYIDAFAVFDRAQLLDMGGYDTSFQAWEDHALWLNLATNGREIIFVPTVLGYYYLLPESMSVMDPSRMQALLARFRRMFNQLQSRHTLPLNTRRRRYHPALGSI